jgi:hypothetical protein
MPCYPKKTIFLILIFCALIGQCKLFCQDSSTTFFGPYYRTNQFLPLLIYQHKEFNAIWVENKYTKDALVFNNDNVAEALIKISPDGTRLEIVNKVEEKKILNIPFRILAEETPLIVSAGENMNDKNNPGDKYINVETNLLPSMAASYEMIEVLILKDSYPNTLTPQQTNAIKEWVVSGGIIIFESIDVLKKHKGLAAALLKQTNPKFFESLNNDLLLKELGNKALKINNQTHISNVGYGYIGIKSLSELTSTDELRKYCDGQIEWRIRNRNNFLSEKNSLKSEISEDRINITQKTVIIYFLLIVIALFLQFKNHFLKISCAIATLVIIPIFILTPSNKLDSHYYQLLEKKPQSDYSLLKEEVFLNQGSIPSVSLKLTSSAPFFVNNDAKITLIKNLQGQYIEQTIQSNNEYFSLKKTSITRNSFFEKIKKENTTYFYHKFPLENVYEITEDAVEAKQFRVETFNQNGLITKLEAPIKKEPRDNFENKTWYAASNKIFYSSDHPTLFTVLEGTTKAIPLEFTPNLNIQKSYFSYILTP